MHATVRSGLHDLLERRLHDRLAMSVATSVIRSELEVR